MFSRYLRGKIPEQASGSARQGLPLWLSRILNCSQAEPPICSSSFRGLSFPETRLVSGSPLGGRKVSIHTTLPARRHRFWIGRCRISPRRSLSAACGRLSPRRRPKDSRHAPHGYKLDLGTGDVLKGERGPTGAIALIVAVLSMTLSGCSGGKLVLVAVAFQPGTVSGTASSVLHHCGQSSTVRRIDTFERVKGRR